eukprot:403354709
MKYFWNNILKKEEIYTILFLIMFLVLSYGILTYDPKINYFSLDTMKIATFVSLGLSIYSHMIEKKKVDERTIQKKNYERYNNILQNNWKDAVRMDEERRLNKLRSQPNPALRSQSTNIHGQKQLLKDLQEWNPINKQQTQNLRDLPEHRRDQFKLVIENDRSQQRFANVNGNQVEVLPLHPKFAQLDKRLVQDSMKKNFFMNIDGSEQYFTDLARRTKHFLLSCFFKIIIGQFANLFQDFSIHLLQYYNVIIILDQEEYPNDLIVEMMQIFKDNDQIASSDQQNKQPMCQCLTLEEVLRISNFQKIESRFNGKSEDKLESHKILSQLRDQISIKWELFRSTAIVNSKFSNREFYVIKRLKFLTQDEEDYNFKGGSSKMLYKNQSWSRDLPSDPEIISAIFCRYLDDNYFTNELKIKQGHNHYLDSLTSYMPYKLPDDQLALFNNQPVGYIPYYQYVAKKMIHPVLPGELNLFHAITMIYSQIKKDHHNCQYGKLNVQPFIDQIILRSNADTFTAFR